MELLSKYICNQVNIDLWNPIKINPTGPSFSHLFYVHDLTLLANTNLKSIHSIKQCLLFFSQISGQKINTTKFKIIFSKNCDTPIKYLLANIRNIKISDNFRKYLGFPILTPKLKGSDLRYIIDNMNSKLASWKTNFIFIAGRTTLARSILNSIPNHSMQYILLPAFTLKTN